MSIRVIVVAFALSVVAALAGPVAAKDEIVAGSVTYLNRSALPPGAVLDVKLVDVSLADAPSVLISSRRFLIDRVPFQFELAYDPALIDERYSYAIQAKISHDNKVLYRTTTHYPALTRNAPERIDVIVDLMPNPSSFSLEGSSWDVDEIAGNLLDTEKRPSINFLPDGRVAIDSGCNKFNGPVKISGSAMAFSDKMAGTLMACMPPYDKLENELLALLPLVTGWDASGEQLALTDEAGKTILLMSRSN